jgi:hypothetical protein
VYFTNDWADIVSILKDALLDPEALYQRQQALLEWYEAYKQVRPTISSWTFVVQEWRSRWRV